MNLNAFQHILILNSLIVIFFLYFHYVTSPFDKYIKMHFYKYLGVFNTAYYIYVAVYIVLNI